MGKYYTVKEDDQDMRIDRFVRRVLNIPQSLVEKFLRKGVVLLDNAKVKSNTRIKTGNVIYIKCDTIIGEEIHAKICEADSSSLINLINSSILYEDDDVLIINKPAGISVQGGTKVRVSIGDILDKIRGGESMRIVHRLDKNTSGVLMLARNARASRLIMHEFKNRRVEKKYLALTQGIPENDVGEINHSIIKKKHNFCKNIIIDSSVFQEAITSFFVLKRLPYDIGLLELKPKTGRKHQIRVHLSHIGCPIIGDKKYGKFCNHVLNDHLQLHAHFLSIDIGNKKLSFTAPMPDYMKDTIMNLEKLL
ncbi:RluA family pseudouridine synthase [Ehrlichia minasensis]|uniref:Pseudouridine synthase n=1 Tax=Ehrlichia minasensis TaxID=1242993 RepID=A0A4Q6I440_9RICK|nr:RluA family pseudouridine synthase [Ehrlichia minasensis]RZB12621.1 RluA family pseudouridine synthase [Ehrlichia minasensis]